MKKKTAFVMMVCLGSFGCAGLVDQPPNATTPEAFAYLYKAMQTPLTFSIEKGKADDAWSRINTFISKYSSMKIQTATDFVVETYNSNSGFSYAYKAMRTYRGDLVEFSVACYTSGITESKKRASQNAHILALYAMTGELRPELISE